MDNTTTIVIAVDGSPTSLQAVRRGMALVQNGLRAHIALVHVQEPASLLELATQDADAIAEAATAAGEHLMAPATALLDEAGLTYSTEVVLGDPGTVLLDMAESLGACMLIVGARGMGAIRRAFIGSVSQAVLNRATLPVLVVKDQEEDEATQCALDNTDVS
jgi:nucleotide-binding universal stress UspA family protein